MSNVDNPSPLTCDRCSRVAESIHVVPELDTNEPRVVLLACGEHDPGGDWWLLHEVNNDELVEIRALRPELPSDFNRTPAVEWKEGRATTEQSTGHSAARPLGGFGIAVLIVVGFLYFNGRLDHALYPIGLNHNECARNGFGATFCGAELEQYRRNLESPGGQVDENGDIRVPAP